MLGSRTYRTPSDLGYRAYKDTWYTGDPGIHGTLAQTLNPGAPRYEKVLHLDLHELQQHLLLFHFGYCGYHLPNGKHEQVSGNSASRYLEKL